MVRISYADIRRRTGRDVRDDIVIDLVVIRIKPEVYLDVRIELLKIFYGLIVYLRLGDVGIVLCPENYLVSLIGIKSFRHRKLCRTFLAVTACKRRQNESCRHERSDDLEETFSHPLVPSLDTPSMILFLKIRKRIMRGNDTATTAAIMAGMLSLPKPFSRIS